MDRELSVVALLLPAAILLIHGLGSLRGARPAYARWFGALAVALAGLVVVLALLLFTGALVPSREFASVMVKGTAAYVGLLALSAGSAGHRRPGLARCPDGSRTGRQAALADDRCPAGRRVGRLPGRRPQSGVPVVCAGLRARVAVAAALAVAGALLRRGLSCHRSPALETLAGLGRQRPHRSPRPVGAGLVVVDHRRGQVRVVGIAPRVPAGEHRAGDLARVRRHSATGRERRPPAPGRRERRRRGHRPVAGPELATRGRHSASDLARVARCPPGRRGPRAPGGLEDPARDARRRGPRIVAAAGALVLLPGPDRGKLRRAGLLRIPRPARAAGRIHPGLDAPGRSDHARPPHEAVAAGSPARALGRAFTAAAAGGRRGGPGFTR